MAVRAATAGRRGAGRPASSRWFALGALVLLSLLSVSAAADATPAAKAAAAKAKAEPKKQTAPPQPRPSDVARRVWQQMRPLPPPSSLPVVDLSRATREFAVIAPIDIETPHIVRCGRAPVPPLARRPALERPSARGKVGEGRARGGGNRGARGAGQIALWRPSGNEGARGKGKGERGKGGERVVDWRRVLDAGLWPVPGRSLADPLVGP